MLSEDGSFPPRAYAPTAVERTERTELSVDSGWGAAPGDAAAGDCPSLRPVLGCGDILCVWPRGAAWPPTRSNTPAVGAFVVLGVGCGARRRAGSCQMVGVSAWSGWVVGHE
jgi:hypothetical protein